MGLLIPLRLSSNSEMYVSRRYWRHDIWYNIFTMDNSGARSEGKCTPIIMWGAIIFFVESLSSTQLSKTLVLTLHN